MDYSGWWRGMVCGWESGWRLVWVIQDRRLGRDEKEGGVGVDEIAKNGVDGVQWFDPFVKIGLDTVDGIIVRTRWEFMMMAHQSIY